MKTTYKTFDIADYLNNEEVIIQYLSYAVKDLNSDVIYAALGQVAKVRGMAKIAKNSGSGRESYIKH